MKRSVRQPPRARPDPPAGAAELRFVGRFLEGAATVVEAGAHTGEWSAAVLAAAPEASLHLFEPAAAFIATLVQRLAGPVAQGRARVNPCALAATESVRDLHVYADAAGQGAFHRRAGQETEYLTRPRRVWRVPAISLDEYCSQAGLRRIHLLRMDVGGSELEILHGARQCLQRGDIDAILFEYGSSYADAGVTLRDLFEFLQLRGYELFRAGPDRLQPCSGSADGLEQAGTFLAAHNRFRAVLIGEKAPATDPAWLFHQQQFPARGVVHAGAAGAPELERYHRMGFSRMLFIHADQAACDRLRAAAGGRPEAVIATRALAGLGAPTPSDVRLDGLLRELGLDPADFNLLCLRAASDAAAVLEGAAELLPRLDAVHLEWSAGANTRSGQLEPGLEDFLGHHGFEQWQLAPPDAGPVRAFFARQPVITMSTLGNDGRFASQLFQYAFLQCYAREHGCRVETPSWIGRQLFGCADPFIAAALPPVRERSDRLSEALVPNAGAPFRNVDFQGAFQYHTSYYAPHRELVRGLFQPAPAVRAVVAPALARLRARGRTVVGLHLRGPAQGGGPDGPAADEWYVDWLRGLWPTLDQPVLFIAGDTPDHKPEAFAEFHPLTLRDLGVSLRGAEFYPDFYLLSHCDALAIAHSAFSFAAAMLNARAVVFARPCAPAARLVPFDPWNSEVRLREARPADGGTGEGQTAIIRFPHARTDASPARPAASRVRTEHLRKQLVVLREGEAQSPGPETCSAGGEPEPRPHPAAPEAAAGREGTLPAPRPDSNPAFPRFSFVVTVFNGMPFLEFALRAVYDFAHEIIVVEGAVEECRFAAGEDGGSTDGTIECLRRFPDPQGRLRLRHGLWPDQGAMRDEALRHVTGDYVWLLNADEVLRSRDLEQVRRLVRERPEITQINFIPDHFWKGFDDVVVSPHFFEAEAHSRRVFKFAPGARFLAHRAPALTLPGATESTEEQHCISGDETRALGIAPGRYGLVVESRVAQRIDIEHRCGRGRQGGVDLQEWLRECYGKWTPLAREEIERRHAVWPGGGGSHTQPFTGEHPEALRAFIRDWRRRAPAAATAGADETRLTRVIGGDAYLRLTLEAWKHLQLDAPLLQRRAVIEQCLAGGTSFWNRPVALAFLADRLKPASYLEVGVRAGGSFAQVLAHAPVREAVGLDLWAGTYADLPNTRGLAAGQLAATLRAAGHECAIDLRQGECRAELGRLRRQGRSFDLISVDEDQIGTGARADLDLLLQLLNPCGAILIEGLILPGRSELLTVVRQFAQAHPDLRLILNTRQDNGTAILLRGCSVEELCPEMTGAEPASGRGLQPAGAAPRLSS